MEEKTILDDNKMAINILLLGRTQSGKSAAGNILLNSIDFTSHLSHSSVTMSCSLGCSHYLSGFGRRRGSELALQLRVLDTPGYPHSSLSRKQVQEEIKTALHQHFGEKGLHLVLLVLRADIPLCEEEDHPIIQLAQELLDPDWKNYTAILFTHADWIDKAGLSREEYLCTASASLNQLVESLQQKYIFIDSHVTILKPENVTVLKEILALLKQNSYQTILFK